MENCEKVFIIQPKTDDSFAVLHSEAISLIQSAGAEYCGTAYQNIKQVNPSTYLGSGKLEEIKNTLDAMEESDITVLFNGELSPSQTLNISACLGDRKVIDRTTLILDIFARNAVSSEGKIQVELAQLRYIYPRLKGKGSQLSRLGGGIGSRGPGETQLETDRRYIRTRIKYLENKLSETELRRTLQTERRAKENVKIIALVGYTNTGKSTLMNALTNSDVLAKDALFATLDPTARKFEIDGHEFLLVDTVGFLQQLPHNIIESFKSTLESALNCDLALFVCDASGDWEMQFDTSWKTLKALGFNRKYLKVLNKCDNSNADNAYGSDFIRISAKYKIGFDNLKSAILHSFDDDFAVCELLIPYDKLSDYSRVSGYLSEKNRVYRDNGIIVTASIEKIHLDKFNQYLKSKI
ncbi:MAG: GTPase HflX [Clostridia bacterium]|nr:GTPase HflX [Clostridia bacterium]